MNRDEILKIEAGHEMDVLVAEKVMGWKRHGLLWYGVPYTIESWKPSTNFSMAWEVVEKMGDARIDYNALLLNQKARVWIDDQHGFAEATSVPLAICRAALLSTFSNEEA